MAKNIKHISQITEIIAGDKCFLREIFHPERDLADINFSLAYAYIEVNGKTINHYLKQSETYYILQGEGLMHINDESFVVNKGSSYVVEPLSHQWIENTGTCRLEFLVIVDPAWKKQDEVVIE